MKEYLRLGLIVISSILLILALQGLMFGSFRTPVTHKRPATPKSGIVSTQTAEQKSSSPLLPVVMTNGPSVGKGTTGTPNAQTQTIQPPQSTPTPATSFVVTLPLLGPVIQFPF